MLIEDLKKIMPDASEEVLSANLKIINADAKLMVDKEVNGLVENKTKLLDQMDKLKKNQVPEGFDAEAFATYTKEKVEFDKKKKELDDAELEGKGQWEALKLQLNELNATKIIDITKEKDREIQGLQSFLQDTLIDNASISAINKEKGNSLFLLPHMKNKLSVVKTEDNKFEVQVFENGNQRFKDDATTPFTVADLVSEMKANESFAPAFPEINSGGGGKPNGGGGGGSGVNPWKSETKNITMQAKLMKENPSLAAQYKKAAGVA